MIARPKVLIAGLLVLALSIAILYANRSERATEVTDELVEATSVLPQNEGRLVIVSGTPELADGGVLSDEEANLHVEGAVYYLRLPMQKVYVEKTREVVVDRGEDKRSTVDDVTKTEHYVAKQWIVANGERVAVAHGSYGQFENPAPVNLDSYYASGDLRVAGFKVSETDVSSCLTTEERWFTPEELAQSCEHYITRSEIDLQPTTDANGHGMLSTGEDVGDVRVTFSYETLEGAEAVTLVGRQSGESLVLEDDLVSQSESVMAGTVSKDEFLDAIGSEDASSRTIGIGGVALGAVLLLASLNLRH